MSVPFIDLKAQYARIQDDINAGIQGVLEHGKYIMGPEITELESQLAAFCGAKHAITCSNGTDALSLGLMAYDIGPGDAVFTTPFTFFATAEVIALAGATPVFVDIDPRTFNIDPVKLEEEVARIVTEGKLKPRGIIPVNLFGLAPDFDAIELVAKQYDLFVLEDTAQGFGGLYKGRISGSLGDVSSTSFFPAKPLGCYGDGGAIFTNDDELAHTLRGIVNHGMYVRYHHDVVGVNSRLDSIQAAVLRAKLPNLDSYCNARRNAARKYNEAFSNQENIITPKTVNNCTGICENCDCHVFHQYTLKITNGKRDALVEHFGEKGIPCGVYYPIPLHRQKAYLDDPFSPDIVLHKTQKSCS